MMRSILAAFSSSPWAAVGNHAWQCTLFGAVAALLVLLLRNNDARARYWLWMVASTKFLVPFSLLFGAGNYLGRSKPTGIIPSGFSLIVQQVGRPFVAHASNSMAVTSSAIERAAHFLPNFLFALWICGCAAILRTWWLQWRRVRKVVCGGVVMESGRECEVLRRVERNEGMARELRVQIHPGTGNCGQFSAVAAVACRNF